MVAGAKLKSASGWTWNIVSDEDGNGTDEYKFSALPGGFRMDDGKFSGVGSYGHWWTTITLESANEAAFTWNMMSNSRMAAPFLYYKIDGNSVRCVKN